MVIPIAIAYIADFSAVGAEGSHMSTFSISLYPGMGIGPLAGGVISATAGVAAVFLAMTAFSLLPVAVRIAFVPEPGPRPRPPLSGKRVFAAPAVRAAVDFQLITAFANGTFMVFVPLIASLAYGLSTAETGLVISVSSLSTSVLQRWSGRLADRYDKTILIVGGHGPHRGHASPHPSRGSPRSFSRPSPSGSAAASPSRPSPRSSQSPVEPSARVRSWAPRTRPWASA